MSALPLAPIVIRVPRRLDSPNRYLGRHWRAKHQLSQGWEADLWACAVAEYGPRRLGAIKKQLAGQRVRVQVERYVPSRRNFVKDDDNLRFTVKPVLDALKRLALITNDSREWLEHETPTQHVSADGKDRTVVTIALAGPRDQTGGRQ